LYLIICPLVNFMNRFCTEIILPKSHKAKQQLEKSLANNIHTKRSHVIYWWNWHQDDLFKTNFQLQRCNQSQFFKFIKDEIWLFQDADLPNPDCHAYRSGDNFTNIFERLFLRARWEAFFDKWFLAKGEINWQISPYILRVIPTWLFFLHFLIFALVLVCLLHIQNKMQYKVC